MQEQQHEMKAGYRNKHKKHTYPEDSSTEHSLSTTASSSSRSTELIIFSRGSEFLGLRFTEVAKDERVRAVRLVVCRRRKEAKAERQTKGDEGVESQGGKG